MASVNSACGEFCSESVKQHVRQAIGNFSGVVENIYFHRDANCDFNNFSEHQQANNDNDGTKKTETVHRVLLSFVLPCSRQSNQDIETVNIAASVEANCNSGSAFAYKIPVARDNNDLVPESIEVVDAVDELNESLEFPSDMDINDLLGSWNSAGDGLEEYCKLPSGGLLTLSEEQLHAEIDNQLSKKTVGSSGISNCPLFRNVEIDSNDNRNKTSEMVVAKHTPPQTPHEVRLLPREIQMGIPIEMSNRQEGMASILQKSSVDTAAYQITTIKNMSCISHQPIQYHFIPQVVTPTNSMNQVAYNVKTAHNQNLGPTLPTASPIATTREVSSALNWTSQATTSTQATVINLQQKPVLIQPAKFFIPSSQPSVSISGQNHQFALSPDNPSPKITKARSRKTHHGEIKHMEEVKVELRSQFADFPKTQLGDRVPEGYTYESWILQEGLYKARQLGLHKIVEKDFYPFKCPLCDKKYKNPNGIKYHAKYAHGPKCVFTCSICKREYETKHGLSAHRRSHRALIVPVVRE